MVTSTVRDDDYQRRLVARNREATRNYSLHTTGWAFDIARQYRSKVQALAFQFVLDRLQVLDAIAWVREPAAIHVTAAPEGKALLPAARASTTRRMTDAIRTPDPLLEGLPDFPYEPHYRTVDGLRLAHVDEGDGRAGGDVARRADLGLPVAPRAAAGARRRPPRDPARPRRLRPLGQADRPRLVLLRPPRRDRRRRCSRTSTCATRPSSSTTGAGRSGCGWRSSTPTAWRGS